MKVLVIGGCATRAYVEFFQKCLPEWEVRSALLVQAEKWVKEEHEGFLSYVDSLDVITGLTTRSPVKELVPDTAKKIELPSFDFFGLHPDSIFLLGITSPLDLGVIHSKIVASSYAAGNSVDQTLHLFNKEHFDKLGYLTHYDADKKRVIDKFIKLGDIDLTDLFADWEKAGNFLYTVNHPHTEIFFDIVCKAVTSNYPNLLSEDKIASSRAEIDDYMGRGLIWPVYPEIAEKLDLQKTSYDWRTSAIHEEPKHLGLEDFINKSYEIYSGIGEFSPETIKHLGGLEKIQLYSGIA